MSLLNIFLFFSLVFIIHSNGGGHDSLNEEISALFIVGTTDDGRPVTFLPGNSDLTINVGKNFNLDPTSSITMQINGRTVNIKNIPNNKSNQNVNVYDNYNPTNNNYNNNPILATIYDIFPTLRDLRPQSTSTNVIQLLNNNINVNFDLLHTQALKTGELHFPRLHFAKWRIIKMLHFPKLHFPKLHFDKWLIDISK